jgi:hypothetical protein
MRATNLLQKSAVSRIILVQLSIALVLAMPVAIVPPATAAQQPPNWVDLAGDTEAAARGAPLVHAPTADLPYDNRPLVYALPEDLLYDNGPQITHPGGGYGGADASALQTALGMNSYGFGQQFDLGYWVADDFVVADPGGWDLTGMQFFAYQTNSGNNPTITGVYYRILDGAPDAGGNVVCGDLVTNRLTNTVWSSIYRVLDTDLLNTARPTMLDTVSIAAGCGHLAAGSYWIMWSTDGSLSSGPWAPPISILGQTTTGNAMQSLDYGATWADLVDSGTLTQQGLPFRILGTGGGGGDPDIGVNPASLSAEQCPDTITTQTLRICNTGGSGLTWSLSEQPSTAKVVSGIPTPKVSRSVELKLDGVGGGSVETNPPSIDAPVSLVLDDGSRDNDIGIGGNWEFIFLNRFTPDPGLFPFYIDQVSIYFSSNGLVNVGDGFILALYENTSGNYDPAVGSNFLASFPVTAQAIDAWNDYTLPAPVTFNGPGDVLVGVVAVETPGTSYWPAAMDQTTTQQRSWAGWWLSSPPPSPPTLPPDDSWVLIDDYFPGNWMVRAYGETAAPPEIPWLSEDPTSGTIPAGTCQDATVTFDSNGLTPGNYHGNLVVDSNDPDEPQVTVPVQLTVVDCAGEPDIEVSPTSLHVTLNPNKVTQQSLSICNRGNLNLTWALAEAAPKGLLSGSMPMVGVVEAPRGAGNAGITASSPAAPLTAPEAPANPAAVLWDQPLSSVNQNAYVNQDFTDYPDYSSFLADDFVNGQAWNISTIFVPGNGWNGFSTLLSATGLTWQIYADDGGVPAGDPYSGGALWSQTLAPTDPRVTITVGSGGFPTNTALNLAVPVAVPAGHWWLVFYPTMAFDTGGQYGRQPADTTSNYWGQFINPGGAFGYGGDWQSWSVIGATQHDIAFRLEGAVGGAYNAPWLSENPVAGAVPASQCANVTVTFDSTGLAPGSYYANLLIDSNDADEPRVTVPVHLTVVPAGGIEASIYMPLVMRSFGGLADTTEPNDSFAQAWGPMSNGQTYNGFFLVPGDTEDYSYFNSTSKHTLELWLTNIPSGRDYQLYLYDNDFPHNLIGYSDNNGNTPEHILTEPQAAGKYFVRVRRKSGGETTQPYTLRVVFR